MIIPPKEAVKSSLLLRIKNPILISRALVLEEQHTEELLERNREEFASLTLEQLEAWMSLQKKHIQKTDLLYLIRLSGLTGVVLVGLGLTVSVLGLMNGLISVAVAGLTPWVVVIADVLSRAKNRSKK